MKLPRKNKQWAKEAINALQLAVEVAEAEHGELSQTAKEYLYKYGPMICAKNRGINSKEKIREMAEYAIRKRLNDFTIDPDSISYHSINFLLSYLDSHVSLKIISENKVHEIMEFLTDNYEIDD